MQWSTVDGGGGTSSGGQFSLSGILGQPDAGTESAGNYALIGGFWSGVDVMNTPGAPWLAVEPSSGGARIYWPLPAANWVLDQAMSINTPAVSWAQVAFPYQTNATHIFITVPAPAGNRFYRLRKP